ncbi:MAG: mechanosensitive ion channel domain-containing protein [Pseudomonadota bacterium]
MSALRALAAALALAMALLAVTAVAQSPASLATTSADAPADLDSQEAVRDMVARLSDAEVRALLLERLDAVAADKAAETADIAALAMTLDSAATGFGASVSDAAQRLPGMAETLSAGVVRFWEPRGLAGTLHLLAVLALALALAWLSDRVGARLLRPQFRALWRADWYARTPLGRLRLIAGLAAVETAQAAAFLLGFWAAIETFAPPEPMSGLILSFFLWGPVFLVRATAVPLRVLLTANGQGLRLVNVSDAEAAFLERALLIFAALVGLRDYALAFFGGHGVPLAEARLGFWLSVLMYLWLIGVVWQARAALTRIVMGHDADKLTPGEVNVARLYPQFALALIVGFWVLGETLTGLMRWDLVLGGRLPLTLAILIFAPGLDTLIRGMAYRAVPQMTGKGEKAEAADAAYRRGLIRVGRILALAAVVVSLAGLWNVSLATAEAAGFGARFALRLLDTLGIIASGYFLCEVIALWVNRRLSGEIAEAPDDAERDGGGEGGGVGGSRLSTVLPLISLAAQTAVVVLTFLFALATLGVDTTPLLAGAGIVGLAVGFGAQKLVADIVSGIFFLIDDAFRTGEYVEVEGTFGTVEKISVRSLQLRHHEGPVHTIPFSDIPRLTNYSRDWVIMKLRFTVPFETDLMKVKKLFKQIGREMLEQPQFADDFLQPFKSQGVLEVDDVGLVVRGKFMAKPGRQWVLRKEIFARVQKAFEENGIQFARREVRVQIGGAGAERLSEDDREALAGAAAEAASPPRAIPGAGA